MLFHKSCADFWEVRSGAGGIEEFVDRVTAENWSLDTGMLDEDTELEIDEDSACRMLRQR